MAVCSSAEEGLMETLLGVHKNGAAGTPEAPSAVPAAGNINPKTRRRKIRA
jgi:hypothetical protein